MVTSGNSRQSSRPFSVAGSAASASRSAAGENSCGISWEWIAIRLTAFSVASEPSRSRTRPEARPKPRDAHDGDADQIAVLGAAGIMRGDVEFAPGLLLVDRQQPSAAVRQLAEDAEHAALGVVDQFDDAALIRDLVAARARLDPQQRAVADAGNELRPGPARDVDHNLRRRAVLFVPFGGAGDQFAVSVAADDVGHQRRRQRGGLGDLAAALLDRAVVDQFAQQLFQRDAIGVLQPELAGDLADADLAGMGADERDDGVAFRKTAVAALVGHMPSRWPCRPPSWPPVSSLPTSQAWSSPSPARAPCSRRASWPRPFSPPLSWPVCRLHQPEPWWPSAWLSASPILAARLVLPPPPLAARSSISAMASASVMVSGVLSL